MNDSIIVSLASYDKRISYLEKTISSILSQTLLFDKLYVNIPDDTNTNVADRFKKLEQLDSRIQIKFRPAKWRSANKLIWTYKENQNSVIITCDDDICYPLNFFEALYEKWKLNKDCIIAHEISPVFIINDKVQHISTVDLKFGQKCFGRYLSGCCLFPPKCFDKTDYLDFNKFFEVTNATHDELWFWCITTLKGIRSIGLNFTMSFDLDEVVLPRDQYSLSTINSDPYLKTYNKQIDKVFGKQLVDKLKNQICEFPVNKDNLLAYIGNMQKLNNMYGIYYSIKFVFDETIQKSHTVYICRELRKYQWHNISFEIERKK